MMFFGKCCSGNSSQDAKSFAPCFRVAGKSFDFVYCADIVLAVSVFLCLICAFGLIDIIEIIILNIIIISNRLFMKKRNFGKAF
jgi:hypothetical protein